MQDKIIDTKKDNDRSTDLSINGTKNTVINKIDFEQLARNRPIKDWDKQLHSSKSTLSPKETIKWKLVREKNKQLHEDKQFYLVLDNSNNTFFTSIKNIFTKNENNKKSSCQILEEKQDTDIQFK